MSRIPVIAGATIEGSKKRVSVGPKPEIWTITQRPGPCGQSGCAVAGSEYTLAGGSFLRDLASKWSPEPKYQAPPPAVGDRYANVKISQ